MDIVISQHDHVTVVTVTGSIDAFTADGLVNAFGEQVRIGNTRLVAAFQDVEYTSSAGLRVLLGTVKEARRHGGDLRLAAVRAPVLRVLELSGFTSILKCFADVPTAVGSFPA
jgi:anti-sigma B factor antagonist